MRGDKNPMKHLGFRHRPRCRVLQIDASWQECQRMPRPHGTALHFWQFCANGWRPATSCNPRTRVNKTHTEAIAMLQRKSRWRVGSRHAESVSEWLAEGIGR